MLESSKKNGLLVKNRALGDSVMGLSTVQYIRRLYPNCKLYYAIPSWILPLYDKCDLKAMGLDALIPLDLKNILGWWRLFWTLKSLNLNFIHEMHQNGRSAKFLSLFSCLHRIKYTAHNHHLGINNKKNGAKSGIFDQGVIKELIQRDLDGAASFHGELFKKPSHLDYEPQLILKEKHRPYQNPLSFSLGPVATRETKMWPISHYKELMDLILKDYPKATFSIALSKSLMDQNIKKELLRLGVLEEFISHPDLSDLPSLMASSSYYIGNDTGQKHIAVALGLKTATFFGPEPYLEWHPYDKKKHLYFYREGLSCRTKTHHYCGLSTCESMICLKEIKPRDVWEGLKHEWNL